MNESILPRHIQLLWSRTPCRRCAVRVGGSGGDGGLANPPSNKISNKTGEKSYVWLTDGNHNRLKINIRAFQKVLAEFPSLSADYLVLCWFTVHCVLPADYLKQSLKHEKTSVMPVSFTEPHIIGSTLEQTWFVSFSITNDDTGETKRMQKRGPINYHNDLEGRKKAAAKYLLFWKNKLKQGWHPFEDANSKLVNPFTPFHKALDFAYSKCTKSKAMIKDYGVTTRFIQKAAEKLGLKNYPIGELQHQHILLLLETVEKERKWSGHAYNKNAGYLCSIIGKLRKWKAIKENPAEGVERRIVPETHKYVPYTPEEKKAISEYLYIHHYRLFVFLMVEYHTGIRPKEILFLRIEDISLKGEVITIIPEEGEENTKTKKIRRVPINKHLLPFFREMHLEQYPEDYFVFGSPYQSGRGNSGSAKGGRTGAKHPDYFKPSPVMIKRDTVTKLWNEVVIDKLGIKKHLYAAKHTGADDKILAGIDLDALKELYGHSSKLMTEKYVTVLKQVHFQKIKEASPSFI